jgi:nitrogen fixation protein FixH
MRNVTDDGREFTGKHMLLITLSFFAVVIAVNLMLAFMARSSWPGLVVENSYIASQSFDKDLKIARRQHALGWQDRVTLTRNALDITITDHNGLPLTDLNVIAILKRPATDTQDVRLTPREDAHGVYSSPLTIGPGIWDADVTIEGAGQNAMRNVHRLVVR